MTDEYPELKQALPAENDQTAPQPAPAPAPGQTPKPTPSAPPK